MMRRLLIGLLLWGLCAVALAEESAMVRVDFRVSSPSLTFNAVNTNGKAWTPRLHGYLTHMFIVAPDIDTATTYTISALGMPQSLPLYTTASQSDASTASVTLTAPGAPLIGDTRFLLTLGAASTTDTVQTVNAYMVYSR